MEFSEGFEKTIIIYNISYFEHLFLCQSNFVVEKIRYLAPYFREQRPSRFYHPSMEGLKTLKLTPLDLVWPLFYFSAEWFMAF